MGALLVCGIKPPENCAEIPEFSTRLDDGSIMTRHHMRFSIEILEEWNALEEERKEECKAKGKEFVPRRVTPWEFVLWCTNYVPDLAKWLPYFIEERCTGDPPDVINPTVVELALSMLDAVEVFSPKTINQVYDPNPPTSPKFNGELGEVLKMAWKRATDRTSAGAIFQALIALANTENPPTPLLRYDGAKRAVIWGYENKGGKVVEREFAIANMRSRMRSVTARK